MATKDNSQPFKVGDRVKILHSVLRGRIVEERGPLGAGGMLVYRVRIPHKPKATDIEVGADQLARVFPKLDPSPLLTPPKVAPSPLLAAHQVQPHRIRARKERNGR